MERICLFPGTFDPITLGHIDILRRALPIFDKIVVGIGRNANKSPMFTTEQRIEWVNEIFKHEPRVSAQSYDGLTIQFCKKINAKFILRGIRFVSDFEYEKTIADANRSLDRSIETVFLTGEPQYTSVASTIVRDILRNGGDASSFLPPEVNFTLLSIQH
jgi:pantetheine-phosphate adenylyltransferase